MNSEITKLLSSLHRAMTNYIQRKLFWVVVISLTFNGCITMDIVDIILKDDTFVHYAEVKSITRSKDSTTLFFVDGFNYEISNSIYISPGDIVKVYRLENGSYTAKLEEGKNENKD